MQSDLIADIWNVVSEHVPEKEKQEVAKGFVTALVDHGVSEIAINELFGIDTYLDTAIEYVTEDEDDGDTNYDEDVDNAVAGMTSLIEPIMIVFLALVVGFIVIALFLPIVGIIETIGK